MCVTCKLFGDFDVKADVTMVPVDQRTNDGSNVEDVIAILRYRAFLENNLFHRGPTFPHFQSNFEFSGSSFDTGFSEEANFCKSKTFVPR